MNRNGIVEKVPPRKFFKQKNVRILDTLLGGKKLGKKVTKMLQKKLRILDILSYEDIFLLNLQIFYLTVRNNFTFYLSIKTKLNFTVYL
jgi:hypothetical protein